MTVPKKVKMNIIPRFYRLRVVKLVNQKYLSCSCGLSARMKYPCRHIMCITEGYSIEMFSLRWLIIYQHTFDRKNYNELSEVFRHIQHFEFSNSIEKGEVIPLINEHSEKVCNNEVINYPKKMGKTTDIDVYNMKMIKLCSEKNKVLVRGYDCAGIWSSSARHRGRLAKGAISPRPGPAVEPLVLQVAFARYLPPISK